jgi:phosphomannomutase
MTIVNPSGSGIVIGRGSEQTLSLDDLLDEISNKLSELSENDRSKVQIIIDNIRSNPSTENTNKGIKAIYDITIGAAGSTIGSLLARLIGA